MKMGIRAEVRIDMGPLNRRLDKAKREGAYKCALEIERAAKLSMKRGGKRKAGTRVISLPSRPGTAPHVQTGALRASIMTAPTAAGAVVGPTAKYGAYHEFGTKLLPKRPFMRPAIFTAANRYPALLKGIL